MKQILLLSILIGIAGTILSSSVSLRLMERLFDSLKLNIPPVNIPATQYSILLGFILFIFTSILLYVKFTPSPVVQSHPNLAQPSFQPPEEPVQEEVLTQRTMLE